jgi:hypothetical protein
LLFFEHLSIQTLVSGCIALILNENVPDVNHSVPRLDAPTFPKEFSRAVIKLVGRYLLAIKVMNSSILIQK